MSDEPTPELRALAAQLFAAGRRERPGPALGRRLMLLDPPRQAGPSRPETLAEHRPILAAWIGHGRSRWRSALWLAAAAVLSGAIAAGFALSGEPSIAISAERIGSSARAPDAPHVARAALAEAGAPTPAVAAAPLRAGELHAREKSEREAAGLRATRPALRSSERATPPPTTKSPPSRQRRPRVTPRAASPAVTPEPAAAAAKSSLAAASGSSSSTAPRPLTLLDELELLESARRELRSGGAGHALELLDRHARERRSLNLDAEATLLRIEAYAALGRHGEASDLAARFLRENPNSALGDRAKSFIRGAATQTSQP